jgi:hypothetical protein
MEELPLRCSKARARARAAIVVLLVSTELILRVSSREVVLGGARGRGEALADCKSKASTGMRRDARDLERTILLVTNLNWSILNGLA